MIASKLGLVRGKDAWDQLLEHWPSEEIPPPDSMTEWITSMLTTSYIQKTITGGNVINIPLSEACVGSAVLVGLDYTEIPSSNLETIQEYEMEFGKLTDTSVTANVTGSSPNGFSFNFAVEEALVLDVPIIIYGVLKGSQIIAASRIEKTYPALLAKGGVAMFESIDYVRRPTTGSPYIMEEVIALKSGLQYRALATSDNIPSHPKDVNGGFKIDGGAGSIPIGSYINWGMLGMALAENKSLTFEGAVFSSEYTWNFSGGMSIKIQISRPTALPAIYKITFNGGSWSSLINSVSGPVVRSTNTNDHSETGHISVSGWVTFGNDPDLGAYIYLQTTDTGYLLVKTRYASTISGSASNNEYMWQ